MRKTRSPQVTSDVAPKHPSSAVISTRSVHGRVLIIDDDELVLRCLRRVLGRDFAVVCASGAREALGLLSDGLDVDVALCDLAMPGMGGIEFYREVCRRFPELHSSVIFLSGGCGDGDSKVSVESVGGRYISKPWCPQQLHSSIVEAIAQKRVSVSRDTCGYDSEHDEGDEPPQSAAG